MYDLYGMVWSRWLDICMICTVWNDLDDFEICMICTVWYDLNDLDDLYDLYGMVWSRWFGWSVRSVRYGMVYMI